jgi:hypothetical protein
MISLSLRASSCRLLAAAAIAGFASSGAWLADSHPAYASTAPAKTICTGNAQGQPPQRGEQDHCTVSVVDPSAFTSGSGWGFHIDGPSGVTVAPGGCASGPNSAGNSGGPDGCGFYMTGDAAKGETLATLTFDISSAPAVASRGTAPAPPQQAPPRARGCSSR